MAEKFVNDNPRKVRDDVEQRMAESLKAVPRHHINPERHSALNVITANNRIVQEILNHHSVYPFRKIGLTCKESQEAKSFYINVLQSIEFSRTLGDVIRELIKYGEAILVFEGKWVPPKFLSPESIIVAMITNESGQTEEHIEHKVAPEVQDLVTNTPADERKNLFKLLDPYSIRQIELGRYIDLTRSPYIKVLHPKRLTSSQPNTPRGVSYFEPILDKLVEVENIKDKILHGGNQDYHAAIKRIREIDRLTFEYGFPQNIKVLENEFKYLQDVIRFMLTEQIFKQVAMAKNFTTETGLILPKLQFSELNIENDEAYKNHVQNLRQQLGIDMPPISVSEYLEKIRKEHEDRNR